VSQIATSRAGGSNFLACQVMHYSLGEVVERMLCCALGIPRT